MFLREGTMTTLVTDDARHPALIERVLATLLAVLATISPPPQAEETEDIDWEDGEPEEKARAA